MPATDRQLASLIARLAEATAAAVAPNSNLQQAILAVQADAEALASAGNHVIMPPSGSAGAESDG